MPKVFRPSLQAPAHRRVNLESRRPRCCVILTILVLGIIFAGFMISAWNLYHHRFEANDHRYHQGDQVALSRTSKDFTSVLCDAYNVKLENRGIVFLLPHRAEINVSNTYIEKFSLQDPEYGHYSVREIYLLSGSDLTILACHENDSNSKPLESEILLIKGKRDFDTWRHDSLCSKCIFKKMIIPKTAICKQNVTSQSNSPANFSIEIKKSDQYRLIVHSDDSRSESYFKSENFVNVTLSRTRFEINDAERNCSLRGNGVKSCQFNLPWDSHADVVVDFSEEQNINETVDLYSMDTLRKFRTKCQLRLSIWILIFVGTPLVLATPITFSTYWFLCRKQRNISQLKKLSSQSETAVRDDSCLVRNEVVQSTGEDNCMGIQDG